MRRNCLTKGLLGLSVLAFATLSIPSRATAQLNAITREEMLKYTAKNPYERFPDGRPKVPDTLLEKIREMSAEEVLSIARQGYPHQFAGNFDSLKPGKTMVGRAFTLQLMPQRAEVADVTAAEWSAKVGGRLSHQTALDMLQEGDVFVVDAFGNLDAGGIVGDNLAYYVWKTTKAGFVIDGAIRDLDGIAKFDMPGYYRGAVPPAINNVMVTGINVPVRIGDTTVMPGDVVLGDREGVFFIPPHLVQGIVDEAEITHVHDEWTKKKFDEGKYKSTEIYGRPSDPALIKEYEDYLKQKISPEAYARYEQRQQQFQQRRPGPAGGQR
jgi:4-hydroxy-4-methyl-2-oxoglutarate aldolase